MSDLTVFGIQQELINFNMCLRTRYDIKLERNFQRPDDKRLKIKFGLQISCNLITK